MKKHFYSSCAERVDWNKENPVGEWLAWLELATVRHYIPHP